MHIDSKQRAAIELLEEKAHAWAEEACEREVSEEEHNRRDEEIRAALRAILGFVPTGFFWNGDPRGYSLKIDSEEAEIPQGMATDWGGYGILAHKDTDEVNA